MSDQAVTLSPDTALLQRVAGLILDWREPSFDNPAPEHPDQAWRIAYDFTRCQVTLCDKHGRPRSIGMRLCVEHAVEAREA